MDVDFPERLISLYDNFAIIIALFRRESEL